MAGSAASDSNRGCTLSLNKHAWHFFAGATLGGNGRVRDADDRIFGAGVVLGFEIEVGGLAMVVVVVLIGVLHGLVVGLADEEGVEEKHEEGGAAEDAEAGGHNLHRRDAQSTMEETEVVGTVASRLPQSGCRVPVAHVYSSRGGRQRCKVTQQKSVTYSPKMAQGDGSRLHTLWRR